MTFGARNKSPNSQSRVTASSTTTGACYGYIKRCNMIGRLSLRLGEGGSCSLGLGITCVLYHSTMHTRHPDLVSFAFYAIPIFHIII